MQGSTEWQWDTWCCKDAELLERAGNKIYSTLELEAINQPWFLDALL
jgi:hypothetical protein